MQKTIGDLDKIGSENDERRNTNFYKRANGGTVKETEGIDTSRSSLRKDFVLRLILKGRVLIKI